ncbi:putative short/branched chain specific acyl-CoA dehydrogenase [Diplonema papillatum]|nr:putative short/branched chain specific acyl-CoA dehydrogenase [Diplonema papillatum]
MQPLVRGLTRVGKRCFSCPALTSLNEDELALKEMVANFARAEIAPRVMAMDEAQKMDDEIIRKCFEQGLMGIETSAEYGGADLGFFGSIIAIEELAKVDPSVSVMVDVQNTLVNNAFFRYANKDMQAKYLPMLATDTLGSFCLSEAGSGSDAFALKTRAESMGGGKYVINGSKMWITNSGEAGLFLVMANVDPSKGYKGITCFVVSKDNPGLKVGKKENKLGIRSSSTCEVLLQDCEVHETDVVGEVGKGYKIAIELLNEGRVGIGSQMVGLAQGAFDVAVKYAYERKQFGVAIGTNQGMQHQIAQAATNIQAARLMVYNAARKKANNEDFIQDAAMAKLFASQVAGDVASKAVEWMGGVGFVKDYPAEKFYRDAKIGAIYEGTSNIQLTTIAKMIQAQYA